MARTGNLGSLIRMSSEELLVLLASGFDPWLHDTDKEAIRRLVKRGRMPKVNQEISIFMSNA